mmetsp:Transcript_4343/g.7325  ORF Transcript_4343/g.7325 Transcript_4343/m.7325 type:complete len:155 (+) Transcript_4343:658-1122(+)
MTFSSHILIEIFFNVNKFQLESMRSQQAKASSLDLSAKDKGQQLLRIAEFRKNASIQECVKEIQRIFKSIVHFGSAATGGAEGSDEDLAASGGDSQRAQSRKFDDMHVLQCMNQMLSGGGRDVFLSYDKVNKMLRNFIIFSKQTIEDTQIEVYA